MSSKAELKRVRMSLERERLRLNDDKLQIEKARRALTRERAEAVAALRVLCERYGDNAWDDETALATIIEIHLGRPLARLVIDVRAATDAPPPPARVVAPAPLRPTPVPSITHRCLIVDADDRGVLGRRATCVCGWRSAVERDERSAILAGERHRDRFEPAARGAL